MPVETLPDLDPDIEPLKTSTPAEHVQVGTSSTQAKATEPKAKIVQDERNDTPLSNRYIII